MLAAFVTLFVVAALVAAFAVGGWRRARRHTRTLARRYVEAIAVLTYVAHTDPAVATPAARRFCIRLLDAHRIDPPIVPEADDLAAMYGRP